MRWNEFGVKAEQERLTNNHFDQLAAKERMWVIDAKDDKEAAKEYEAQAKEWEAQAQASKERARKRLEELTAEKVNMRTEAGRAFPDPANIRKLIPVETRYECAVCAYFKFYPKVALQFPTPAPEMMGDISKLTAQHFVAKMQNEARGKRDHFITT